ncbi:MAG: Rrf2 family transcriptional regulator [Chloroflexi bacterium]|nr:Rrf2 family transcriptional regulator [Chloroflexota bacterium]
MKLSTRGRYGTRALLDVALHQQDGPVLLKDIARRQGISLAYLENLVAAMVAGGIVRSIRGRHGGIMLARPPDQIRVKDIVLLLDGPIGPVECVSDPAVCIRSGECVTRDLWSRLRKAIEEVLESTTVQGLVEMQKEKEREKGNPGGVTYEI